jgi:hypothetical protein
MAQPLPTTSLKDNRRRGNVGEFLDTSIENGSRLSFVSAYFTLHAYHALRDALERAHSLRFLFGEPRFVSAMDRDDKDARAFRLTETGLSLGNQLSQKKLAAECADWIAGKSTARACGSSTLSPKPPYPRPNASPICANSSRPSTTAPTPPPRPRQARHPRNSPHHRRQGITNNHDPMRP